MSQKRRRKADPGSSEAHRPPSEDPDVMGAEDQIEVPVDGIETPETEAVDLSPLEQAEANVQALEDRVRRLQAEFLNDTKRMKRQAEEDRKYAIERVVLDLMTVFDALHMARQGIGSTPSGEADGGAEGLGAMTQGLDLLEKELLSVLGRHGVERMEASAEPFDPALHEALYVVEDPELGPNTVARVLRPGFTLHGRVVRPAHVAVTKGDESPEAGD